MITNPKRLLWSHPTSFTNGSALTALDVRGYELMVDGAGAVAVPVAWAPEGQAEFPLESLALPDGEHTAAVRIVSAGGVPSAWSEPVTFSYDRRIPERPILAVE